MLIHNLYTFGSFKYLLLAHASMTNIGHQLSKLITHFNKISYLSSDNCLQRFRNVLLMSKPEVSILRGL